MSLSDCTDTLQPFARLFSLSKFKVIYVHCFSPCVCALPYFTNRTGESDIFLALPLGELSAGLRGQNSNLSDSALSGSFFEGAVSLLTEGVTYLPFPTLSPLLYPNIFYAEKISSSDFSFCSPQGHYFVSSDKVIKTPVRRKEEA